VSEGSTNSDARGASSDDPQLPRASGTVARLQALAHANDATTYLEIGVSKGSTFLHANFFELRHGVDPWFQFDIDAYQSESVRCFAMTSDEFFTRHVDSHQMYDIVFLDGRHTFEQTFRDFCCSQRHAHGQTIWLIDDVHPNDIFAAYPDMRTAYRFRESHGLPGNQWMGDVFKVVFAIHDFFPNLSYRTIRGRGNPQTVVVRRPRDEFKPIFNDLEKITRMTYYEFVEYRSHLNFASEEEVMSWARA